MLVSVPFFTAREALLRIRFKLNSISGTHSLLKKDKDDVIASTGAGMLVGGWFAYFTRGPRAVAAGCMAYGFACCFVQMGLSLMRNYRLEMALRNPVEGSQGFNWRDEALRTTAAIERQDAWDPVQDFFKWLRLKTVGRFAPQQWSSPLLNAIDSDHRRVLNAKIVILQDQIESLKTEIKGLE